MEVYVIILLSALFIGALSAAVIFWRRSSQSIILQEKLDSLESNKQAWQEEKNELEAEKEKLIAEKEKLIIAKTTAETQVVEKDKAIQDWEKHKQELIAASKTAALQSLTELSTKLLSDHKSETEVARKLGEKSIQDVSKNLQGHFDKLVGDIKEFEGRLGNQENAVSILQRVLTEPTRMGSTAEMILENALKAANLNQGVDYLLQGSFENDGSKLRPDAIIFLPDDNAIIIDSKISGALADLALAEEENTDDSAVNAKLKTAMRNHLKGLISKDYQAAVKNGITLSNRFFKPRPMLTVMWMPTDGVLERVNRADPNFTRSAFEKGVLVAGPSALQAAIAIAAIKIAAQKQSENQVRIIQETEILLKSINTALTHANRAGKAIHTAYKSFDSFAASVNQNLLSKAKKLIRLGIEQPTGDFGTPLPRDKSIAIIEATEEQDEALLAPDDSQEN